MQTLVERGCGLDVHQATVVACLLIVSESRKVHKQVRTFGTNTRELISLREWLLSEGCTHVAMESTGVYWKPIYAILEGAFETVVDAVRGTIARICLRSSKRLHSKRASDWCWPMPSSTARGSTPTSGSNSEHRA
jgi:Transposase